MTTDYQPRVTFAPTLPTSPLPGWRRELHVRNADEALPVALPLLADEPLPPN